MKAKTYLFSLLGLAFLYVFSFSACDDDDPEVITNTVVQRDTVISIIRDTIFQTDTVVTTDTIISLKQDSVTTFILVRHAETDNNGIDPGLSSAGQIRSNNLRDILARVNLSAIYSTDFKRTRLTAQPTANAQSLPIQIYDGFDLDPFIDSALANYKNGVILVTGHTNITPQTLNVLTGTNQFNTIPSTDYSNLFIATVYEKGNAEVMTLVY